MTNQITRLVLQLKIFFFGILFFTATIANDNLNITYTIGGDFEYSDNKVLSDEEETQSATELYGSIDPSIFYSSKRLTLMSTLDFTFTDDRVFDREDRIYLALAGFYTLDNNQRFSYNFFEMPIGLTIGGTIWGENKTLQDVDRESNGIDVIANYKFDSTSVLPDHVLRATFSQIESKDDIDRESGFLIQHEYTKKPPLNSKFLGFDEQEIKTRISLGEYELDQSSAGNEDLMSFQIGYRLIQKKSGDGFFSFQIIGGYDKLENFRGNGDLESTYIRVGFSYEYNSVPFVSASGTSAGGRWRRP